MPIIVKNLPMNKISLLGLLATVIQPMVPNPVKMIKQRRRPSMFDRTPPNGLRHIAHKGIIAAVGQMVLDSVSYFYINRKGLIFFVFS